jgi:hypothetical protein
VILRSSNVGDQDARELCAWTLNVSRGGLRVVVEDPIVVGVNYLVSVGEDPPRLARVVWLREEADGQIAGMQFTDVLEERASFLPVDPTSGS